jgi:MFS family permease
MTSTQRSILAVAILAQGISVGLTYGILPVFLGPLEAAFDAPRTQISAGQIVMMFALAVGSVTTGVFLDRGHARNVMLAGASLLAAALIVASLAPNLWVLGLAAVMAGFAVPSVGPLAGASLITRAFDEERGRAIGLMSMGPPLGSGFFAALAGWALITFEWRGAYLLFAGVALATLVPMIAFWVPARFESTPATSTDSSAVEDASATSQSGDDVEPDMAAVVRMPTFWWSAGVFALAAGIMTGWTVHVAAFLVGLGLDETESARILAVQYWMGVPGALVFGMLADRVRLTTLFLIMLGTGSAVFAIFSFGPAPAIVAVLCGIAGFAFGGVIPLYMLLLGQRMGPDALGRAMGLSNLVMLPVMAGAVLLAAANFESSGSYEGALVVFSIGMIASIGCLIGSNWSTRRR